MEMVSNSIKLVSLRYNVCVEVSSTGNQKMAVSLIQDESNIFCPKQCLLTCLFVFSNYRVK